MILAMRSFGGLQPGLTLFNEGGVLYKHEISVEDKKKQLSHLGSLIEWLRKNCSVKPVNLALTMKKSEKEKLGKLFGKSVFDSVLLAKEHGMLLYTDDGRLRGFAEAEHKVKGVWTDCLLRDALAKGILNSDQFMENILALLSLNVHHVSIDSGTLLVAARKAGWKPDHPFTSALFNLSGHRCGENSAVVVAGEFLYALWREVLPPLARETLVFTVLETITMHRRRDTVLKKMEQFVAQKFMLWPQAQDALLALIEGWKRNRLL